MFCGGNDPTVCTAETTGSSSSETYLDGGNSAIMTDYGIYAAFLTVANYCIDLGYSGPVSLLAMVARMTGGCGEQRGSDNPLERKSCLPSEFSPPPEHWP
jgi:hypothetical protein